MAYYFYVLRSKKDGALYKGVTEDVQRRLAQHNAGKTKSLRCRIPLEVAHVERYPTLEQALAREKWSKTIEGGRKLRRVISELG